MPLSEDEIERTRLKARFCLETGIAPSEFDGMTDLEVEIFTEIHNQRHKNR